MAGKAARIVFISLLAGLFFYLSGCTMYMAAAFAHDKAEGNFQDPSELPADPREVSSAAAEVTLAWDPPPSAVAAYRVLYRIHQTGSWFSLTDSLPAAPAPEFTVRRDDLHTGIFDFGVIAVNATNAESNLHLSLDSTAQPDTGWFLVWED